jgi:hypothetical protein
LSISGLNRERVAAFRTVGTLPRRLPGNANLLIGALHFAAIFSSAFPFFQLPNAPNTFII